MTDKLQNYAGKLIACLRPPKVLRAKPALLQHENLLCMPLSSLDTQKLRLQGGLYSGNSGYIPSSGLITNKQVIVGDGPMPPPSSAPSLTGNSLYLGVCHYHFGHFFIETLSRLWFLNPEEIKKFVNNPFDNMSFAVIQQHMSQSGADQERQHFSRKLKWGPSDFSGEKLAGD